MKPRFYLLWLTVLLNSGIIAYGRQDQTPPSPSVPPPIVSLPTKTTAPAVIATNTPGRPIPTRLTPSTPAGGATALPLTPPAPPAIPNRRVATPAAAVNPPQPGTPPATLPGQPQAGAPAVPANLLTNAIVPSTTNFSNLLPTDKIPAKLLLLQSMPLEQVLTIYAELTGRTVLRPNSLPAVSVTLKNQTDLTKEEAIQALDSVLTLNMVTMINVGTKFVTAVPSASALQEGAAFSDDDPAKLPETAQFMTKIVQLKYALPSEVLQLVSGFARTQNAITAIDSTQTLVIRDYVSNIKRIMELIAKIDVQVESDYKLEVIPIKYGKVEDIYATMSSLVGGGGGGGATGSSLTRSRTGAGSRAGSRGGSTGSSRSGMNSMNQANRTGGIQPQAQLQGQLGGAGTFNRQLQGVLNRTTPGEVQILRDARIVPDERANSLIVFASKEDMHMITNVVSKVDRLLAQVLIEAIIMDVKLSDSLEYGVSAMMPPQKNGRLTSIAGMNNGQSLFSGVSNLTSGLPGGFTYFGKYGGDLNVAVTAIAGNGRGQVLQTPRVQTSHAMPATFFTGETVPYITSSSYGGYGYGASSQYQQLEVGISLDVTPYITPDGLVVMDIQQTIEEVSGYTEIANVGKVPNTTRREASSMVSVRDSDTIMLGGYIRNAKNKGKSGIPILMDIPGLGALFRKTTSDNSRSELIVLLRPTVLATPQDAAIIAGQEQQRMPGIREMEEEMRQMETDRNAHADKKVGKGKNK